MKLIYRIPRFFCLVYFKTFHGLRIVGRENFDLIAKRGGLIASNHVSYYDPPLLSVIPKSELYFLARKTLWNTGWMAWLFPRLNAIPVDQENADMTALKRIIRLVKEGSRVAIFPEGQRTVTGEILPGEPGVGLVLGKTMAPVLPVRIFGAFEAWPRTQSRPKWFKKITLVVGKPIEFEASEGRGKEVYTAYSQRIMDAVAELRLPEK